MYIGDVHILGYVIVAILWGIIGQFLVWCNDRLSEEKSVFTREYFKLTEGIKLIDNEAFFVATDAYQVEGAR